MIWFIVAVILVFIIGKFWWDLKKDGDDLQGQPLDQKFRTMVELINQHAYQGEGTVFYLDKREFNLYREDANEIIKFHYSTGHLTIVWKYKFYHQEVIHQKQFNHVRNMSVAEQEKQVRRFIDEMKIVVQRHQTAVKKQKNIQ